MNKLFAILFTLLLTSNLFAQQSPEKGDLLLEGNLGGVALTSLSVNPGIGIYLTDRLAVVSSYTYAISDAAEAGNFGFGARIHFTESQLMKINLNTLTYIEDDWWSTYSETYFSGGIDYAYRFYFKDWLSFEPYTGFIYDGQTEIIYLRSGVGFNLHFQRD